MFGFCQPCTPGKKEMKGNRKKEKQEERDSHKPVAALLMSFLL
jgi:hypothetical protein